MLRRSEIDEAEDAEYGHLELPEELRRREVRLDEGGEGAVGRARKACNGRGLKEEELDRKG